MAGKSLNKVMLIGNLGSDPELRYTSGGVAVATLNIATNYRVQSPDTDEWQDKTEWHRVVVWRKQAEIAGEYLSKGSRVYVEGWLQTRSWEDQNGNKRYTTEIVTRDLILLGGRGESSSQSQYPPHPAEMDTSSVPTHTGTISEDNETPPAEEPGEGNGDDIPF